MSITFTAREARPASGLILLTMSLGVLIAQIDTSVVNLAVKPIGSDLNGGVTALQWIVDVYNFVYASLLLAAGTLADLYGRRRIFALGIALFTLGTVVCGLAHDVPTLVAGRAVAGLGAALEVPASLAILTIAYPDTGTHPRAGNLGELLRDCHCHWSDRRRRACRCVRLAQHFRSDHSLLPRDTCFGHDRGAGIEQPARPPARSSGAGACDCLARQPFTRSDRGAALGLGFNRKCGCVFALSHGGGAVSASPGGCNRRGGPAAHAPPPRVCGLSCWLPR